jgi:hypothetical protein
MRAGKNGNHGMSFASTVCACLFIAINIKSSSLHELSPS